MAPWQILVFSLIPAAIGAVLGRRKGYTLFSLLAGLLLSYIGLLIVALTRTSHRELVRRERARIAAETEARGS